MAKKNIIKLDSDILKLDKAELNKQVFYPIIKAGYDVAKTEATIHKQTGQLLENLRTISLNKKSKNELGYVLMAGRRANYTGSPHFIVFYTYKNGRIYRKIKRAVNAAVKDVNGN